MLWENSHTSPFTRIGIVASVPSESGVFGIIAGNECLLIDDSWNLKARLLELINSLTGPDGLVVVYELCPENDRDARARQLREELRAALRPAPSDRPPGISFWSGGSDQESADERPS